MFLKFRKGCLGIPLVKNDDFIHFCFRNEEVSIVSMAWTSVVITDRGITYWAIKLGREELYLCWRNFNKINSQKNTRMAEYKCSQLAKQKEAHMFYQKHRWTCASFTYEFVGFYVGILANSLYDFVYLL